MRICVYYAQTLDKSNSSSYILLVLIIYSIGIIIYSLIRRVNVMRNRITIVWQYIVADRSCFSYSLRLYNPYLLNMLYYNLCSTVDLPPRTSSTPSYKNKQYISRPWSSVDRGHGNHWSALIEGDFFFFNINIISTRIYIYSQYYYNNNNIIIYAYNICIRGRRVPADSIIIITIII